MSALIDMVGKKIGKLTVIKRCAKNYEGKAMRECLCACGNHKIVIGKELREGKIVSCGCAKETRARNLNRTHGFSAERLYKIWIGMKKRCYNPKYKQYKDYGGRGIDITHDWLSDFLIFREWSLSNGYRDDLTIDRVDNDKGYCPANCRWVSMTEQLKNKRGTIWIKYGGTSHTLSELSRITGISRRRLMEKVTAQERPAEFEVSI